jgi:pyruvate dehydrogenase E2 component (dihydrolipoamide acetyltransferase)
MATLLRMPGVSADSDEAALESWAVAAGAQVVKGEAVASVETEKAVVDIEMDRDGTLHTLLVPAGTMVAVGDPIAVVLGPGEPEQAALALLAELGVAVAPAAAADPVRDANPAAAVDPGPPPAAVPVAPPVSRPVDPPVDRGRVFASPLARRLAKEHGLEVARLVGSGPGGRIVRDDVLAAAEARSDGVQAQPQAPAPAPAPPTGTEPISPAPASGGWTGLPPGELVPHTKMRTAIARRLQESTRDAPHFYLSVQVRVDALLALRAQLNAAQPVKITVNDLVVKAAARALIDEPDMNVVWTDAGVVRAARADVAVAVATDRGLLTPVISGVDSLSISALSAAIKDVAARAAQGQLRQSELEGGTMSVTNLGMYGIDEFAAILNPPQAGILAVGAARAVPLVDQEGRLVVGTALTATLSVDHRPVDGVVAARWLARFRELMETPLSILG